MLTPRDLLKSLEEIKIATKTLSLLRGKTSRENYAEKIAFLKSKHEKQIVEFALKKISSLLDSSKQILRYRENLFENKRLSREYRIILQKALIKIESFELINFVKKTEYYLYDCEQLGIIPEYEIDLDGYINQYINLFTEHNYSFEVKRKSRTAGKTIDEINKMAKEALDKK